MKKILLFLAILVVLARGALRYRDEEMMKKHHKHNSSEYLQSLNQTNEPLYVHMIPHTHDDVGWLKTIDNYFYGANNSAQWAGVQYIIDTTVRSLMQNPDRKFIYVEVAFFFRWWNVQTPEFQAKVKKIVSNGQLEFINGGWCMSDEANPYYEDLIDQMTIGHKWLMDTFGVRPTIGWHIDPFGHQSTNAALFSQMGFNAWWFARIDYQDKAIRLDNKGLEMIWHPQQASGLDNYIFTSVNYYHYSPPPTFNFDQFSQNAPIMDDLRLENPNIVSRAQDFVYYFRNMSLHYRTNHLMHTFGEDFHYATANTWFKNLDKLYYYINNNSEKFNMKVLYSTPSIYLKAVHDTGVELPPNDYDFLPYADKEHGYWTGYFTSRIAIKGHTKWCGRYLQSVRTYLGLLQYYKRSDFLTENEVETFAAINTFEEAMGVLQHHDAVAGTERQYVANDYTYKLQNSTDTINRVLFKVLQEQAQQQIEEKIPDPQQCNWNLSAWECTRVYDNLLTDKTPITLTVYNPRIATARTLTYKVPNALFDLLDTSNLPLPCEVVCANLTDPTDCDAYFAVQLPAYEISYYRIVYNPTPKFTTLLSPETFSGQSVIKTIQIALGRTVTMYKFTDNFDYSVNGKIRQFAIAYNYYRSYQGAGQRSGAYIFRPATEDIFHPNLYSKINNKTSFSGKIVTIIRLAGDLTVGQLKFFNVDDFHTRFIEHETFIDSVPIADGIGKELTIDWTVQDMYNNKTWYTDSNGLELQKRIFNYRPTWNLSVNEPASGNYYPVVSQISIVNTSNSEVFAVIPDRAQGGASLQDGNVQLMIQRRVLYDDLRGVSEPLNELNPWNKKGMIQKVRHWLVFSNLADDTKDTARQLQMRLDQDPLLYFSTATQTQFTQYKTSPQFPITLNLNPMLKFYLRYYGDNIFLFRLHNMGEYTSLSFASSFSHKDETTLTGNQLLSDWKQKQYKWNQSKAQDSTKKDHIQQEHKSPQDIDDELQVLPLQIRTFLVQP